MILFFPEKSRGRAESLLIRERPDGAIYFGVISPSGRSCLRELLRVQRRVPRGTDEPRDVEILYDAKGVTVLKHWAAIEAGRKVFLRFLIGDHRCCERGNGAAGDQFRLAAPPWAALPAQAIPYCQHPPPRSYTHVIRHGNKDPPFRVIGHPIGTPGAEGPTRWPP